MESLPASRLIQIIEVLFKHKIAIVCFAVGAGIAALFLGTPAYEAEAQLLLQVGKEHVVDPSLSTAGAVRPSVRFEQNEQTSLASEILRGHSLSLSVVKALGPDVIYPGTTEGAKKGVSPDELAARKLAEQLKVNTSGHSTLVKVSLEHADAKIAADVVNAVADGFLQRQIEILKDVDRSSFLEENLEERRSELNEREAELAAFKAEHSLVTGSIDEERKRLSSQLHALQVDGTNAKIETESTRRRLSHLQELQRQSNELNSGRYNSLPAGVRSEIVLGGAALRGQARREQSIAAATEKLQARFAKIEEVSNDFVRLTDQVLVSRNKYKLNLQKIDETNFSDAMDSRGLSSVRIIEWASVPTKPVSSRRILFGLALLTGLCGGVLWAFVLEFVFGTVDSVSDVERYLGTVPITAIPEFDTP